MCVVLKAEYQATARLAANVLLFQEQLMKEK